ncbi:von Willebrand factor C domain-containing protein 2-like isoform X2 [Chrysemys picta bellii]|uniref:von Willebrand factor C domain-containing protein 2-like isoform X2 n=1 Tax=Chrysemys picta bellii TaxID=8478 RepID=UPI0032B1A991
MGLGAGLASVGLLGRWQWVGVRHQGGDGHWAGGFAAVRGQGLQACAIAKGLVKRHQGQRQNTTWPSECEQCTCDPDGIARCLVADCAPPPCVNAVYETGQCCPTCQDGPNCYADRSRTCIIPAGEAVWVEPCTRCRCHDGQDAGYWEGNRVAKCELLRNCRPLDRPDS